MGTSLTQPGRVWDGGLGKKTTTACDFSTAFCPRSSLSAAQGPGPHTHTPRAANLPSAGAFPASPLHLSSFHLVSTSLLPSVLSPTHTPQLPSAVRCVELSSSLSPLPSSPPSLYWWASYQGLFIVVPSQPTPCIQPGFVRLAASGYRCDAFIAVFAFDSDSARTEYARVILAGPATFRPIQDEQSCPPLRPRRCVNVAHSVTPPSSIHCELTQASQPLEPKPACITP